MEGDELYEALLDTQEIDAAENEAVRFYKE